jgi:hypothetical protein
MIIKAIIQFSDAGHIAKINYDKTKIVTAPWPTPISALLSAEEMLKERMADMNIVIRH